MNGPLPDLPARQPSGLAADASQAPEVVFFYDSRCPVCRAVVSRLERAGLLREARARPSEEASDTGLPPELQESLRLEAVLWSPSRARAWRGLEAFLELMRLHRRWRVITGLLALKPLRLAAGAAYRLFAANRRIFSPPPLTNVACPCDPPPSWPSRCALVVVLGVAWAFALLTFTLLRRGPPGVETSLGGALVPAAQATAGLLGGASLLLFQGRQGRRAAALWQAAILATGLVVIDALLFLAASVPMRLLDPGVAPAALTEGALGLGAWVVACRSARWRLPRVGVGRLGQRTFLGTLLLGMLASALLAAGAAATGS